MRMGFAVPMLMVTLGGNSAMSVVTANSSSWEGFYEADDLPSLAPVQSGGPWSTGLDTGSIVAEGGTGNNYLSYSGTGNTLKFDIPNIDAGTNGGLSWEFRLRVNSGNFFMHMYTTSAVNYRWLTTSISTSQVTIGDSGGGGPIGATDNNWHIYRLTSDDINWVLYMDDDPAIVLTTPVSGAYGPTALDGIQFGADGSVDMDFDYVRWTDEGALVPADECGDAGYKLSDFNQDCYVNLKDFVFINNEWMQCTDPANAACDQYYL